MAVEVTKLKTKMAKAHEKTRELSVALIALEGATKALNIDEVLERQLKEQFDNCQELNQEIRKLVEVIP